MNLALALVILLDKALPSESRPEERASLPTPLVYAQLVEAVPPHQPLPPSQSDVGGWTIAGVSFELERIGGENPTGRVLFRGCTSIGSPILRFIVSTRGVPSDVQVVRSSGCARADERAIRIIRKWRYRPLVVGGKAVSVPVTTVVYAGS